MESKEKLLHDSCDFPFFIVAMAQFEAMLLAEGITGQKLGFGPTTVKLAELDRLLRDVLKAQAEYPSEPVFGALWRSWDLASWGRHSPFYVGTSVIFSQKRGFVARPPVKKNGMCFNIARIIPVPGQEPVILDIKRSFVCKKEAWKDKNGEWIDKYVEVPE